jgi:hypothetical protein
MPISLGVCSCKGSIQCKEWRELLFLFDLIQLEGWIGLLSELTGRWNSSFPLGAPSFGIDRPLPLGACGDWTTPGAVLEASSQNTTSSTFSLFSSPPTAPSSSPSCARSSAYSWITCGWCCILEQLPNGLLCPWPKRIPPQYLGVRFSSSSRAKYGRGWLELIRYTDFQVLSWLLLPIGAVCSVSLQDKVGESLCRILPWMALQLKGGEKLQFFPRVCSCRVCGGGGGWGLSPRASVPVCGPRPVWFFFATNVENRIKKF